MGNIKIVFFGKSLATSCESIIIANNNKQRLSKKNIASRKYRTKKN